VCAHCQPSRLHKVTGKIPPSTDGCIALDVLALSGEQDVLSLKRRARARAVELGLSAATARDLSKAAGEAGRALVGRARPVSVVLRATPRSSLEVVLEGRGTPAAVMAALEPVRPLVDRVTIGGDGGLVTVTLVAGLADARELAPDPGTDDTRRRERDPRRGALSVRELQAELEETNRGVVALYAELDDQADRLRSAEDRLRLLLDSVPDYAICMLHPDGEVASWNSGAERIFGYAADEIVGRNFACFYRPSDRDLDLPGADLARARESGHFEAEGLRVRHGGSAFDAHVTITMVRGGHPGRGFSLVVRDITERKRLEDNLRRRAEDLAAANRAKEDFLATLSHELRTPLNAMLGWTRLLRTGKLDAAAMERALETIERNAHIQEQLIADILDVSRIVTGKLRLDLKPTDLAPIVDASLDAVRPAAEAKGVGLTLETVSDGLVLGDADRLQQVIWNLVANAIKFTPSGGHVRVSLARVGQAAVVAVADTGEGIDPDLLPFVFDRFTQGDGSVTRRHGGLGLGLSIVRHIVELHGGHVQAWSEGPGKGATFSVALPMRSADEAGPVDDPRADADVGDLA